MKLLRILVLLFTGISPVFADRPYPPSPVIQRVEFDFRTHRRLAPGSDNWPVTWAADGNLVTIQVEDSRGTWE